AAPQRKLRLHCGDRMDRMRPANCLRRRFGQAEIVDLSLFLEADHFADRIFDRHIRIDTVLVVKVDDLDAEPLEARFACRADIIRVASNAEELALVAADVPELGGQEHLLAPVVDRSSDQFLVLADAIHVGGVEEGHSLLDRMVDSRDRFLLATRAIEFAHAHAAKADRRNLGPIRAELPLCDSERGYSPFCPPSRRRVSWPSNGIAMRL